MYEQRVLLIPSHMPPTLPSLSLFSRPSGATAAATASWQHGKRSLNFGASRAAWHARTSPFVRVLIDPTGNGALECKLHRRGTPQRNLPEEYSSAAIQGTSEKNGGLRTRQHSDILNADPRPRSNVRPIHQRLCPVLLGLACMDVKKLQSAI